MHGTMKKMPGPRAPPFSSRPSRKITARSYSCTTWRREKQAHISVSTIKWRPAALLAIIIHDGRAANFPINLPLCCECEKNAQSRVTNERGAVPLSGCAARPRFSSAVRMRREPARCGGATRAETSSRLPMPANVEPLIIRLSAREFEFSPRVRWRSFLASRRTAGDDETALEAIPIYFFFLFLPNGSSSWRIAFHQDRDARNDPIKSAAGQ